VNYLTVSIQEVKNVKSLSRISKKGIIIISAVIMIMAGVLVAVLPSPSDGCGGGSCKGGHHGHNDDTSYVNVPILNNTGKTITITKMHIVVPGECVCTKTKGDGTCKEWSGEVRVKDIYFGGTGGPTGTNVFSTDDTECSCRVTCEGYTSEFNQNGGKYDFTGIKVLCTISLDVNPAPTGEYTVTYYFTIEGDPEMKSNTITFTL